MKSFLQALEISASGLRLQRIRINTIASNLANIHTTRTEDGKPYMRKEVIVRAKPIKTYWKEIPDIKVVPPLYFAFFLPPFIADKIAGRLKELNLVREKPLHKVELVDIVEDPRPPIKKYDPTHPDADENGYVAYPNINPIEEMVNLISAQRAFEANVSAIIATRQITQSALEIGRV